MQKLRKAAVLVAALSSVGLLGAGAAHADGGKDGWGSRGDGKSFNIMQSSNCRSHDSNVDILGQVGVLNGLGGNLLNGEGNSGAQQNAMGSTMGCSNTVGK
ncbi:hypothetical protein AB0D14_09610 [Streptomyces sp. NPDC048484]|uniref:hypothetical protein n=1 Tax=Streptomyces sp. NPDC048484 TaxID=3155146 RepID=UPI00341C236E